jgi:hypothetical protein
VPPRGPCASRAHIPSSSTTLAKHVLSRVVCLCSSPGLACTGHTPNAIHTRRGRQCQPPSPLHHHASLLPPPPPSLRPSLILLFLPARLNEFLASAARTSPASLRGVVATCLLQQQACIHFTKEKTAKKIAIHFTGMPTSHNRSPAHALCGSSLHRLVLA